MNKNHYERQDSPIVNERKGRMGKINYSRLFLGGVLAGLIYNVSGFLQMHYLFMEGLSEVAARYNFPPTPEGALPFLFVLHLGTRFMLGLVTVWLYLLYRHCCGAGPWSALYAGLTVWLLAFGVYSVGMHGIGIFPSSFIGGYALGGLPETVIASLAGASIYKEA